MTNIEIAQRYLETIGARDFDAAAVLLAADAEVVTPGGSCTGSELVLTEESGVVVSRATRVFT